MVSSEAMMNEYRVLVCGNRNWDDAAMIRDVIARDVPPGSVVITGAARGADSLAARAAADAGHRVLDFPAEWERHGRRAGPIRNQRMLDEGRPHRVLAFHDGIAASRGTRDMIRRALRAGIPVILYTHARPAGVIVARTAGGAIVPAAGWESQESPRPS